MLSDRGVRNVSFQELRDMDTPEKTATYSPLAHFSFAHNTHSIGEEILGKDGFSLNSECYTVSPDNGKMFMLLGYKNGTQGIEMAVAGRNSTDKSMKIALSIGNAGKVTICNNMLITGEVVIMRKHIGDVFEYLEEKLVMGMRKVTDKWADLKEQVELFKEIEFDDRDAHHFFVQAGRKNVIGKKMFFDTLKEYHEPKHEEFEPRNLWSAYNAVTECLKSVPIQATLERHKAFHDFSRSFAGHQKVEATFSVGEDETHQNEH